MAEYLMIDGSRGEGGGQILRTSLALSAITRTAIHIVNVRGRRKKPGLMRQHLTGVLAAAELCGAEVEGAELRSGELKFRPGAIRPGEYRFTVSTAGSACLVFQTVLPALLMADGPSKVTFEGGTHNPMSPPYDFIEQCFVPILTRMGASVKLQLERPGFMPAGGGRFTALIEPWREKRQVELMHAGAVVGQRARALVARLPPKIGHRELRVVRDELGWDPRDCAVETIDHSAGPGNVLFCQVEREHVTELVTAFGQRGVSAEKVASQAVDEMQRYLAADAPVGEHLADQLMLPMALAGGGRYRTLPLSLHSHTNKDIIELFLDMDIDVATQRHEGSQRKTTTVTVKPR